MSTSDNTTSPTPLTLASLSVPSSRLGKQSTSLPKPEDAGPKETPKEPPKPSRNQTSQQVTHQESNVTQIQNDIPPFSVFDARSGQWQKRKRQWLGLGIRSELGRGDTEKIKSIHMGLDYGTNKLAPGRTGAGSIYTDPKKYKRAEGEPIPDSDLSITSIFDPVLCELLYRWFSPPTGRVLDPFAGGSVRGIVASKLGRRYTGLDIRADQLKSNTEQCKLILSPHDPQPEYVCGNSICDIPPLRFGYDFVLTCPPYYNLEQYSEDPGDLSNASSYKSFLVTYEAIIRQTIDNLNSNRFCAWVVGNLRDEKGRIIDLCGDTVRAFEKAGAHLHNDAVIVTPAGSLPMRAARNFPSERRFGRTHQHVLVFVKGWPKDAVDKIPLDTMALSPMLMQLDLLEASEDLAEGVALGEIRLG